MLSTAVRTSFKAPRGLQVRLISSLPGSSPNQKDDSKKERRELHSTVQRKADVADQSVGTTMATASSTTRSSLTDRFIVTVEATVSKIFPAGFGWQTSSIIAENSLGYSPDTMSFALTTGFGDAVGVLLGHVGYYGLKKSILAADSIDMTEEFQKGVLLGSAAFCSGTAWQPLVNAFQGANLPFNQVFLGTWAGCGLAFYLGLRAARTVMSGPMQYIEAPTFANSQTDMGLSVAIGGATGFFVGTDAAYLPDQNFLKGVIGIADGTPDLVGCAIAGSSTALGFMTAQSAMNLAYPKGKSWND